MTWWAVSDGPTDREYLSRSSPRPSSPSPSCCSAASTADSFFIYVAAPALLAGLRNGL